MSLRLDSSFFNLNSSNDLSLKGLDFATSSGVAASSFPHHYDIVLSHFGGKISVNSKYY